MSTPSWSLSAMVPLVGIWLMSSTAMSVAPISRMSRLESRSRSALAVNHALRLRPRRKFS